MKKQPHYITISEERLFSRAFDGTPTIVLIRSACIQRANADYSGSEVRLYRGISEASVFRLVKIQDKLMKFRKFYND